MPSASDRKQREAESDDQPHNLEEILERLDADAENKEQVSVDSMMDAVGRRSFGALILFFGLIAASPLSGIPTVPSAIGIMVVLVAGQLLVGRKSFWLPKKLLRREIPQDKFCKSLKVLRPVGRFVDRFIRPRLQFMTGGAGAYVCAVFCVLIGVTMPPLEIVPFLATTAGAALSVFGLALIACDGLLALIGIGISFGACYLAVMNFMGGGGGG